MSSMTFGFQAFFNFLCMGILFAWIGTGFVLFIRSAIYRAGDR